MELVMLNFSPVPTVVIRKEDMFRPGAFVVEPGGHEGLCGTARTPGIT